MESVAAKEQCITPGSGGKSVHMSDPFSVQPSSSCSLIRADFYAWPDPDGWVRDSEHGLLYWVPPDCRPGLHSPALLTIPVTSRFQSVSLDFEGFACGSLWAQIFAIP